MDIQLKRGLLDVCVLAAIRSEDSYGYKIIKDMKPYIELSESTLYTILKRLESMKMLTVRTVEHDGRLRKYYRITDDGLKRIEEFKNDWKGHLKEIPSFTVRKLIWGFQDDCSPARLLAISINGDNQQGLSASVTDLLLSSSKEVSQIFYCLLCALCLIASVSIYKSGEKNLNVFFIELVIWGYFCLILLSESQSRYKCLILPYLIITAASLNKKGFSKSKDN